MNTYTFIADWDNANGSWRPPVIIAEGDDELQARHQANAIATRILAEHAPGITDLFGNDGFLVAVFEGDVTDALVSEHSVIDARTGQSVIHL